MSSLPHTDDDLMLLDDDGDADGEDQLIDDDPAVQSGPLSLDNLSPSSLTNPALSNGISSDDRQSPRKRRTQDSVSHGPVDKSARKREQREREKEQQKQLIAKLIEIFEAGGGTCAVQQGQKKFPWVDLPAALIRIGCYFAGWPEKCLPKMSDKHPDRIDASTGPSQWSLKQKRAMETQIAKGAVKVLARPEDRAVIFEIVDDFGNIKDSTVEFSENWVRNKLLGLGVVATPPAPHPPSHIVYAAEHRRVMPSISSDIEYSPPSHSLDLPPIRDRAEYNERLDLPSLSQMTSRSGLHTPEDGSRSPSPLSNFSEGRYYPSNLHPSVRQQHCPPFTSSTRSTYPTSSSQDDYLSSRGRMLTLEHGLPRTATSLRSTSRPRTNHPHHHHPYSQIMASHSASSLRSRPPSPLSVNTRTHSHSRSHSGITVSISPSLLPDNTSINNVTRGIVAPYSTGPSPSGANSGHHRFPSHVPNVPLSVVAWDGQTRGWVLKVQDEVGFRALPCHGGGIVCWHREIDEWECRSAQPEIGRALWNRQAGRWELHLPTEEGIDAFLASGPHVRRAVFPTHFPATDGICAYDSGRLQAWVFHPTPAYEAQLPVSPCAIVWSTERKYWSLVSESPQGAADVAWSHEDKTWHFNMQSGQSLSSHSTAVRSTGQLQPNTSSSPRPSSAPHPNTLPPMVIRASSPIQSPTRSNPNRPVSTASSSF